MKVLVTGGAGFIGAHLCLALVRDGHEVIALDALYSEPGKRRALGLGVVGVQLVVDDAAHIAALPIGVPDRIVHLAAFVSSKGDLWGTWERNVEPTLRVLEWAGKHSIPVVYASTCKVYASEPLNRDGSTVVEGQAHSWYGCSKLVGDIYAQEWLSHGLPVSIHRLTTVYGPGQEGAAEGGWVSWFFRAAREGRQIIVAGDGSQSRDLLWVEDYVALVKLVLDDPVAYRGVYQVGTGPSGVVSLNDVLAWLRCKNPALAVEYRPERRHADFDRWATDANHLVALASLGWKPEVLPLEGLEMLWEHESGGAS